MDFRDRLFDLRRQAGLSQEELATLLGLTRQAEHVPPGYG